MTELTSPLGLQKASCFMIKQNKIITDVSSHHFLGIMHYHFLIFDFKNWTDFYVPPNYISF